MTQKTQKTSVARETSTTEENHGNQWLAQYFQVQRRYARSINLERDFESPEMVAGYILTERAVEALQRILTAIAQQQSSAWTLTGVYGTGKSAFALYLAALFAAEQSVMRQMAMAIAEKTWGTDSLEWQTLQQLPQQGLFRAIATARREPVSHTLVRAFAQGAETFWTARNRPEVARQLIAWVDELELNQATFTDSEVFSAIQSLMAKANVDTILVIDELGKNLEYAAQNQGLADLYLLQQLSELRRKKQVRLHVFGLLHQSFADYSQRLAASEKNEWAKIQGRFENILFNESTTQMMRLMGQAIDRTQAAPYHQVLQQWSKRWDEVLQRLLPHIETSAALLESIYPLHPLTALVLPILCIRYAQSDRSLFTFLTSAEPYSLSSFLNTTTIYSANLPTLKLYQVYDYFVESVGTGMGARLNSQRWTEIQGLVEDAKHRDLDTIKVLKTIGILNLVTSTGALRATHELVTLALSDAASNSVDADSSHADSSHADLSHATDQAYWQQIITSSLKQHLITYRGQMNELRLWEGSDFEVESEVATYVENQRQPLASILSTVCPLKPLVAQRHSYRTGTLRYFERQYADHPAVLNTLSCTRSDCDGLVVYWVDEVLPETVPAKTLDGKPLVLVASKHLTVLQVRTVEYAALKQVRLDARLESDGVARREVRQRLVRSKQLLDETLNQTFSMKTRSNRCWVEGEEEEIGSELDFNAKLSEVCDRIYEQSPILWNELINRRVLTTQGAKARRELIEAMLENTDQERLGLQGYGPEVSMYCSVLSESGIHRLQDGVWGFYPPQSRQRQRSQLGSVWQAIEQFCFQAQGKPTNVAQLYEVLAAPPYGMKQGAIPVLLAAVLLHYADEISVYKDGTFIPVLGAEHFELLVKDPSWFAVKHIEVAGLRSQVFQELETVLRGSPVKPGTGRNLTVLSVIKPLVQFVRKLPPYTLKTSRLSQEARAMIQTLLQTQEPDLLLFQALPQACGLEPILVDRLENQPVALQFREKLVQLLREIHTAYETLLTECEGLLYTAFGLRSDRDQLRQDLEFRAKYLLGSCAEASLDRFVRAAADETPDRRTWLEALLMIVADKPAESWTDTDVMTFELNLGDLARRFKHLEALQKVAIASGQSGFEARRFTVSRPDGSEVHRVAWSSDDALEMVNPVVDRLAAEFPDQRLRETLLIQLAERFLVTDDETVADVSQRRSAKRVSRNGKK